MINVEAIILIKELIEEEKKNAIETNDYFKSIHKRRVEVLEYIERLLHE